MFSEINDLGFKSGGVSVLDDCKIQTKYKGKKGADHIKQFLTCKIYYVLSIRLQLKRWRQWLYKKE